MKNSINRLGMMVVHGTKESEAEAGLCDLDVNPICIEFQASQNYIVRSCLQKRMLSIKKQKAA